MLVKKVVIFVGVTWEMGTLFQWLCMGWLIGSVIGSVVLIRRDINSPVLHIAMLLSLLASATALMVSTGF